MTIFFKKNLFLLVFIFLFFIFRLDVFAQNLSANILVRQPNPPLYPGDVYFRLQIRNSDPQLQIGAFQLIIDFGNGSRRALSCFITAAQSDRCVVLQNFVTTYTDPGNYTVVLQYCGTASNPVSCTEIGRTVVTINDPNHCSNGRQDADETGIDCGGSRCPACGQTGGGMTWTRPDINPLNYSIFGELFDHIADVLFGISIIFLIFSIVFLGFLLNTGGVPGNIEMAKKLLLISIAFFVIMLIAKIMIWATKGSITFH